MGNIYSYRDEILHNLEEYYKVDDTFQEILKNQNTDEVIEEIYKYLKDCDFTGQKAGKYYYSDYMPKCMVEKNIDLLLSALEKNDLKNITIAKIIEKGGWHYLDILIREFLFRDLVDEFIRTKRGEGLPF